MSSQQKITDTKEAKLPELQSEEKKTQSQKRNQNTDLENPKIAMRPFKW